MKMIDEYLSALRDALAGSDPAIIQDALFDAEEYLRGELEAEGGPQASPDAVASAIARYGDPAEVAAAYLDAERMRWSGPAPSRAPAPSDPPASQVATENSGPPPRRDAGMLGPFIGVVADPRAWASLFYMVLSLATGIFYFTWVVTGLSLSVGLAMVQIGAAEYYLEFWMFPFLMALGCLILLLLLHLARGIGRLHGQMAKSLLVGRL